MRVITGGDLQIFVLPVQRDLWWYGISHANGRISAPIAELNFNGIKNKE